MTGTKFISSSETIWCKYVLPAIFLVAGMLLLFFRWEIGAACALIALVVGALSHRMQRIELSMGRIRVHRFGDDLWIDYSDVRSIEHREPLRGYEAAVLHLDRDTPLGRRIWFLLERRYIFGGPLMKARPLHPTISSMRTLCEEARSE